MFMKHLLIIAFSLLAVSLYAQKSAIDGYYRVSNWKTERYVYVYDNTGSIDWSALDAEMGAIELWKESSKHSRFSDPASVLYIENYASNQYDIQSQGMGIYKMLKEYITLIEDDGLYELSVTKGSVKKSLRDVNLNSRMAKGSMGTNGSGDNNKWIGTKIDVTTDEWFGITPSIEVNGKFYQPFYADFGFTPVSDDMKV